MRPGLVAGSGTARTCGLGGLGAPLTCCPGPTSERGARPASGLGPRPASWAGVASDFRSGPPSTSTSGPRLGSESGEASLRLDGPPSPGRGSAIVPTSGKRSTGGGMWRSGSRAGSLWVGRPGPVVWGGLFSASRLGTPAEPDGGEGVGGWRSPTEFGASAERPGLASPSRGAGGASGPGRSPEGWRSGAATAGSVGGCATSGPATGVDGEGGVEPPSSPGSASSGVSGPGGSGGSG